MVASLELVAMKVDPETRQKVKVLATEAGVEMWEYVMDLVQEKWRAVKGEAPPPPLPRKER